MSSSIAHSKGSPSGSAKKLSSSEAGSDSENGGSIREQMLKALAARTLATFELDDDRCPSDEDFGDDEEWEGIPSGSQDEGCHSDGYVDDDVSSNEASDYDFDDGEDLSKTATRPTQVLGRPGKSTVEAEVFVFNDPSRAPTMGPATDPELSKAERKSFMAAALQKRLETDNPLQGSKSKRKGGPSAEDKEEAKLRSLDKSLETLISHLSGPKNLGSGGLDAILSSTLPPPTKDKNPQRHPRAIKAGMARANLRRSLAADREALVSGTVRARDSKTITKRQKKVQDGTTARERRERRNRSDKGVIGKSEGGMIKLSDREVRMAMSGSKPKGSRPKFSR